MPFSSPEDHFRDILRAIALIDEFVDSVDFAAYQRDSKTRAAVEREFSILSEAAYRLGEDADRFCPGPDWTGLRGMGNVLRHAYHRVDERVIWDAVRMELPPLKAAVQRALSQHFPETDGRL